MDICALVLAGGFATRLRPLSCTKPKALFEILGRPILDWILEGLQKAGFREVLLSVRHLAQKIVERYGEEYRGLKLSYLVEDTPLGDAGPLRLAYTKFSVQKLLVVYGDIVTDLSYGNLVEYHRRRGGIATVAVTEVEDPRRFGVVVTDDEGRIVKFLEKPKQPPSKLANAGVYVFEEEALKLIPEGASKIAVDLLPKLIRKGDVYVYVHRGLWFDIGVPEDYLKANIAALHYLYQGTSYIHPSSVVKGRIRDPVYIGEGVVVEEDAEIGPNTIICSHCRVHRYARVSNSLLLPHVVVREAATVRGAILAEHVYVGKWATIEQGAVLGERVIVGDEVTIGPGVRICPYKEVYSSIVEEPRKTLIVH